MPIDVAFDQTLPRQSALLICLARGMYRRISVFSLCNDTSKHAILRCSAGERSSMHAMALSIRRS